MASHGRGDVRGLWVQLRRSVGGSAPARTLQPMSPDAIALTGQCSHTRCHATDHGIRSTCPPHNHHECASFRVALIYRDLGAVARSDGCDAQRGTDAPFSKLGVPIPHAHGRSRPFGSARYGHWWRGGAHICCSLAPRVLAWISSKRAPQPFGSRLPGVPPARVALDDGSSPP